MTFHRLKSTVSFSLVLEDPPLRTTSIISATSSEPFYAKWNLANSHDGGLETYIDYCFHSKAQTNGWAEYRIDTAAVRSVGVLNRESVTSAMRLEGARVEVCSSSGGCSNICGTFEDVAASTWSYVKCPGRGIVGSYVRVVNPGDFLQICEMDIRVV